MYTVFHISSKSSELLSNIMNSMNQITYDIFDGNKLNETDAGFFASCEIWNEDGWATHIYKIGEFIDKYNHVLKNYEKQDVNFHIDVAIWEEDRKNNAATCLECDLTFLKMLFDNSVSIEFSIY